MGTFLLLAVVTVLVSCFAFRGGKNTVPDEEKEYNTKYSALNRLSTEQERNECMNSEGVEDGILEEGHIEPFVNPDLGLVYISHGSKKYHRKGCKFIRGEENPITVSEAEKLGLTPCKVCKPNLEN
jgi:hypothetical protein